MIMTEQIKSTAKYTNECEKLTSKNNFLVSKIEARN